MGDFFGWVLLGLFVIYAILTIMCDVLREKELWEKYKKLPKKDKEKVYMMRNSLF